MIRRVFKGIGIAVVTVALMAVVWAVISLTADRPVVYDDIAEHFKYGSLGSEPGGSLLAPVGGVLPPYEVFKALPSICRDKMPGGDASFGLIFAPGPDLAPCRSCRPGL